MKKIVTSFTALAILVMPLTALAQIQNTANTTYIDNWVSKLIEYGQKGTTFLMIIATLWFLWVVISYIREKDSKESEEKKKAMLRGIVGLFVIVAIWGIVRLLATTLGVSTGNEQNTNLVVCPPGMSYSTSLNRCN